jgi:hypothetical protein
MAKSRIPVKRLAKLKRAEHAVLNNPLMKHMRRVAYTGFTAVKEVVAVGEDRDKLQAAKAKRLRKEAQRIGSK